MSDQAPPPVTAGHILEPGHAALQTPVRPVFEGRSAAEIVPGDDSDVEPPDSRDDPAYVAMWSDPEFRKKAYGRHITPEEQERRQRINVSVLLSACLA